MLRNICFIFVSELLTSPHVNLQARAWLVSCRNTVMSLKGVSSTVLHSYKTPKAETARDQRAANQHGPAKPRLKTNARQTTEYTTEATNFTRFLLLTGRKGIAFRRTREKQKENMVAKNELTARMTKVKTPMVTMKATWSWSQQFLSSQLGIFPSSLPSPTEFSPRQ